MMQQLKAYGINTEILSVAKKHYDDMAMIVLEERLNGPHIPLLIDELLQLKIMRDRVDHPRKGSKDLADAVCGSVFNSISRTRADSNHDISIHTYDSFIEDNNLNEGESKEEEFVQNMIRPPRMPDHLKNSIENMQVL
jgi:hypothetical protein